MTSRIGQPDTDADRALRRCLDQQPLTSFVVVAGAGSGKTTSLVKALAHLSATRAAELRRRGQRIACITYTDVAVGEIWGDVGNDSLFHVSTIHSFLWTVVSPFQQDLRRWVTGRIDEKIAAARERLDNPRTRANTRETLVRDIERYQRQTEALVNVPRFTYGTGSDYPKGVLGHDDILKIGPALIEERPLLRTLIANRFPFIFVDESQDTSPTFVAALRQIAETIGPGLCLGFFGDPMQKIYTTGAGPIALGEGWNEITKPENFRCPTSVLAVVNKIRAEDDGLRQIRGRTLDRNGVIEVVEGSARLFILPADDRRTERLGQVRRWLATEHRDPRWQSDDNDADVRVLVLVHRMAARRLGFPNLYAALNDRAPAGLKDGLLDGTAWVLRPFMTFALPLVIAARTDADFDVIATLRANCPLLSKERLTDQNTPAVLAGLREHVPRLVAMLEPGRRITIREVLAFMNERELVSLDDRYAGYLADGGNAADEGEAGAEQAAVNAFLDCAAAELWGYRKYIEDQSPFATQQGVKGAEFARVLVILDDEEGDYNLFSYGKYFGITPLSATDQQHLDDGTDSVLGRTRRLFYVCCSRAFQDLAVVLFVPDVAAARTAIEAKALFPAANIHELASVMALNAPPEASE
ncbi:MAG TPA: UvrD-helicase domain-containing protein [Hyphomicrobium sp.]|jgi:DNA helicase-2/ATP-dependent DNA helicase PcrA